MEITAASLRPLVLAAMTLAGSYSQALEHQPQAHPAQIECERLSLENTRRVLAELTQGWIELDTIYARLLRKTMNESEFDAETFSRIADLLNMVRALEIVLKSSAPPATLSSQHLEFRKAVANTRTRLAQLNSLYRQASRVPYYADTRIDLNGLKELADFTTAGLARIA